jgi:hypothetical protein
VVVQTSIIVATVDSGNASAQIGPDSDSARWRENSRKDQGSGMGVGRLP